MVASARAHFWRMSAAKSPSFHRVPRNGCKWQSPHVNAWRLQGSESTPPHKFNFSLKINWNCWLWRDSEMSLPISCFLDSSSQPPNILRPSHFPKIGSRISDTRHNQQFQLIFKEKSDLWGGVLSGHCQPASFPASQASEVTFFYMAAFQASET